MPLPKDSTLTIQGQSGVLQPRPKVAMMVRLTTAALEALQDQPKPKVEVDLSGPEPVCATFIR